MPISFQMAHDLGIEFGDIMYDADVITQMVMRINGIGYMDVDKETRRRCKEAIFKLAYGGFDQPGPVLPTLRRTVQFFSSEETF